MSQPGPAGNSTLPSLPGRILGIDVGGSGTRVILLERGTVTVRPEGPPMNALLTEGFAVQPAGVAGCGSARSWGRRPRPRGAWAGRGGPSPAMPATSARP